LELIQSVGSPRRKRAVLQSVQHRLGVGRPRWRAASLLAAGAAAVLLALGAYGLLSWKPEPPLARLEQVGGEVLVRTGSSSTLAAAGQPLRQGQGLQTLGDDSSAVVLYPDGTRLELGPDTTLADLAESTETTGKRATLTEGFLLAEVAAQPADRPMILTTPRAEVVVVGTRFRLLNASGTTHIELESGAVQLSRRDDGQPVEVRAGFYAVVADDSEPLAPLPLPPRLDAPRRTLSRAASRFTCVTFAPDGRTVAAGSNGRVDLWDPVTGEHRTSHRWNGEWVYALVYSPDGRTLAVGGKNGRGVRLWEAAAADRFEHLRLSTPGVVQSLALSPDGRTLAAATGHRSVFLWDVAGRQERPALTGHSDDVACVAFAPDGRLIATGSRDGTVRLWDPATGRELASLPETAPRTKAARVTGVAFAPDGGTLAAGHWDGAIRLWDVASRQKRADLRRHAGQVSALAFAPDGKLLASGGRDRTVKLWDLTTLCEQATLTGHSDAVSVAFAPDGRTLASCSRDETVHLWDVPAGAP
jgi:ferric-dicitrate binding protein FerR (iron transport regulator)